MRGKVILNPLGGAGVGITPAHAGKSEWNGWKMQRSGDHPRTCGEKLYLQSKNGKGCRITPAHAGKSSAMAFSSIFLRDHPRTCGEKPIRCDYSVIL